MRRKRFVSSNDLKHHYSTHINGKLTPYANQNDAPELERVKLEQKSVNSAPKSFWNKMTDTKNSKSPWNKHHT